MAKRVFKATEQLAGGTRVYRKWADWEVGDILIGKWVATHVDQYKKNCPVFTVEEAYFKAKKEGEKLKGQNLCLNACGMLEKALESAEKGDLIQIEYTGTSMIEKGPYAGKEAHTMVVDKVEFTSEEADPEL